MMRKDRERSQTEARDASGELARIRGELEAAQCDLCELEFLRQGVRELELTNKHTLAEMTRLERQLAETQAEADAGLDQSIATTSIEAELEAALRQINVLQCSFERETGLRRKTAEINSKHIGDLEEKLKEANAQVREALHDPRSNSRGKASKKGQAAVKPNHHGAGSGSGKQERGLQHDSSGSSAYKEALKEAASDIRGKLLRVEDLRKQVSQSGEDIIKRATALTTASDLNSNSNRGGLNKDPVELNRQIESLNAELNKQHRFTAEVANELKDTKRFLTAAREESEGFRQTLKQNGLLEGEGQERFRETLTRSRRQAGPGSTTPVKASPPPPPVFDPEDFRTDRTPKPLSTREAMGLSDKLYGSRGGESPSMSKAELRERLMERGRLQKPRSLHEWEQGTPGKGERVGGAKEKARFF